jgi:hypothetical protein
MKSPALKRSAAPKKETKQTRIGKLEFVSGYPSEETVEKLYDEIGFQRACQAYLWGIPAVGLHEWAKAHFNVFKAKSGEMLSYLDFDEKLGILTPNYTTPYIATFIDLEKSGPTVLEIPTGLMAGMVMDGWQRVLADLGVVGPDQGKGGKYLVLPPDHEKIESNGHFVVSSPCRVVFAGVRLLGEDKEKAIAELIPGIKTYAWSPTETGAPTPVRHAGDKKWSRMPPRGMAYWKSLDEFIQREPVMERDRLILAQLRVSWHRKGQAVQAGQTPKGNSRRGRHRRGGDGESEHIGQARRAALLASYAVELSRTRAASSSIWSRLATISPTDASIRSNRCSRPSRASTRRPAVSLSSITACLPSPDAMRSSSTSLSSGHRACTNRMMSSSFMDLSSASWALAQVSAFPRARRKHKLTMRR